MAEKICLRTSFLVLMTSFIIYWCVATHLQFTSRSENLNLRMDALTHELQFLSKNYANFLKEYFKAKETQDIEKPIENVIGEVFDTVRTDIAHAKDMLSALHSSISKASHITERERYDFALETSGAEIASIGQTDLLSYSFSYLFFGPFQIKNAPRLVIQPYLNPGECFAFKGSTGEVTIKLRDWLYVDSLGIDHITEDMSVSGSINTAPKEFSVHGMKSLSDPNPFKFGTFVYSIEGKNSAQFFVVERQSADSVLYVSFKFHSNHGDEKFTCVYRTRIFGVLDKNRSGIEFY